MTVPDGDWVRVLRMTLGLAEVARLCVAKGLAPSTSYTFRTRCGVRTEDLGEEWRGEACSLVPEIFGPWSDESAMVKTAALSEKEVMRRRREEMRDEARAMAKKRRRQEGQEGKEGKEGEEGKKSKRREAKKTRRRPTATRITERLLGNVKRRFLGMDKLEAVGDS